MDVPVALRKMVCGQVEEHARKKGDSVVTAKHMQEMAEEYGIDSELMSRFE